MFVGVSRTGSFPSPSPLASHQSQNQQCADFATNMVAVANMVNTLMNQQVI